MRNTAGILEVWISKLYLFLSPPSRTASNDTRKIPRRYTNQSNLHNRLLTTKLREDGLRLRAMKGSSSGEKIVAAKEKMMQDIVRILTLCLGPPPAANEKFTWQFYDSSHNLKTVSMTPIEFADITHVNKFFSLVNDPRHEFNRLLTVDHLGNVWGGRPVRYVNVETSVLRSACVSMLKKGLPVFFGSDSHQFFDRKTGVMDMDLIDYDLGFNVKLGMSKAERLMTGESTMTHAMILTAVHLDEDGNPVRWRVENSWSEAAGMDGYFVMADPWLDEFCYQAIVDPSFVSKEVRDVLKQSPKVLPLWDPMGELA